MQKTPGSSQCMSLSIGGGSEQPPFLQWGMRCRCSLLAAKGASLDPTNTHHRSLGWTVAVEAWDTTARDEYAGEADLKPELLV